MRSDPINTASGGSPGYIRLLPVASGSTGNCMLVELEGRRILIDLGVTAKMLFSALSANGLSWQDIEAVLVTHTHTDHVKGLDVCMKKMTAPLYMSGTSKERLDCKQAGVIPYYRTIEILPGVKVTAFRTSHDCLGSVGFRIEVGNTVLGYATDLGVVTDDILDLLSGADLVVIEANHEEELLLSGPYPAFLKKRILSDHGHLSNDSCAEAAARLAERGTKHFFLAHLSQENNRPELALDCVRKATAGMGVTIEVLPVYGETMITIQK